MIRGYYIMATVVDCGCQILAVDDTTLHGAGWTSIIFISQLTISTVTMRKKDIPADLVGTPWDWVVFEPYSINIKGLASLGVFNKPWYTASPYIERPGVVPAAIVQYTLWDRVFQFQYQQPWWDWLFQVPAIIMCCESITIWSRVLTCWRSFANCFVLVLVG